MKKIMNLVACFIVAVMVINMVSVVPVMADSSDNDANLISVAGKSSSDGAPSGVNIANAIVWYISVDNTKSQLSLSDITVAEGAAVNLYTETDFTNEITGSSTLPLIEGGNTTAYLKITAKDGMTSKYYKVTIYRVAIDDYKLNGISDFWVDGIGTIYLNGSNDTLEILNAPQKEKKIQITAPDNSNITIKGNSQDCKDLYIVVENDITLNLENLNITAPDKKEAIMLNKTDNATDTTMTINVAGTCNIKGKGFGSGIRSVHDQKLIICGDGVLNVNGGNTIDGSGDGGKGIYMEGYDLHPGYTTIGPGADLIIDGDVTINATGGSTNSHSGGDGILVAFGNIVVKRGTLNAKSGISYSTNYNSGKGLSASSLSSNHNLGGNITIEGGKITATGGDAEHAEGGTGIYAFQSLSIKGGDVTAAGGNSVEKYGGAAINVYEKNIDIAGGTVTATGGMGKTNPAIGIYNEYGDVNITQGKVTAIGGNGQINGSHGVFAYRGDVSIGAEADVTAIGGNGATGVGGVGIRAFGYIDSTTPSSGKSVTISADAGKVFIRGGQGATEQRASIMGKDVYLATGNIGPIVIEGTNPRSIKNKSDGDSLYLFSVTANPAAAVVIQSQVNSTLGGIYTYKAPTKENGVAYMWLPLGSQTVSAPDYHVETKTVTTDDKTAVTIYKSKSPEVPTDVTATAGNGTATIKFTEPKQNGGSAITGYKVYVYHNGVKQNSLTTSGSSSSITVSGLANGTPYTFKVIATNELGDSLESEASNEVTPYQTSSGGSSGGGSSSTSTKGTSAIILVNGKSENAGTATTSTQGNQTVTRITVDPERLEQKLNQEGKNALVTIFSNTASDVVEGQLTGQMVKQMELKEAVLEVKTEKATYSLPAQQINIDAVSAQLGTNVELKDINLKIQITEPKSDTVKIVEDSAKKGNFTIIASPVDFKVSCIYGGKTISVSNFSSYVERTIAIPNGVDPSKITTGVVVDPDETVRHVPTKVTIVGGKYYAVINSLTNSLYSVVWHPMEFKDVTNHWAKEAINNMGSRMVINGIGEGVFEPDRDITRSEFAAIMVRALGLKPGIGSNTFKDVNGKEWYCDYIKTAADYKIITGYGNDMFGPTDKITREQAMTMIARAMKITGLKSEPSDHESSALSASFADSSQIATWAKDGIESCVKSGIVSGKNEKNLAPKDEITRAEVATIVQRLLKKSQLI